MKICFLSKDFTYNGGGERMLCNLANHFSRKHTVTVYSFDFSEKKSVYSLNQNINLINCNIQPLKPNIFTKLRYIKYIKLHKQEFNSYDVIISVGIICNYILAICSKFLKTRNVAWEHFCYNKIPLYQKMLRRIFFRNLDDVVVLTEKDLPKYLRCNKNSVVIHNFTQMQYRKKPNLENKQFIYIGRLSYQKGFDCFLKIAGLFLKKNSDWKFLIIGNGEYKQRLDSFILEKHYENNFKIIPISNDVQSELEKSTCMLMTSRAEGLPMVLIEAAMCGIPAISFDIETGPSDIIKNNITGFICKKRDINQFSLLMERFARDLSLQKQMSVSAQENSYFFSEDYITKKWDKFLEE